MRATLTDVRGVMFSSTASYRADGSGEIHLDRDPSLSGSYVGEEPMGLLWSMKADRLHRRLQDTNSLDPHVVKFSVHEEEGRMLAEVIHERLLIGDGVSRVPVKEGNVCGILFTPPGRGPFPAVLDLNSGKSEKRACLLANKGRVVLSMTLYNDKPAKIKQMRLDHLEVAGGLLKRHSKMGSQEVGVIARSKGRDVAISFAAFVPGVEDVVCLSGCNANVAFQSLVSYKTRQTLGWVR